jgi:hypothetical protein
MPEMPQIGDDDSIIALHRSDSKIDFKNVPEPAFEEQPKWLEADLLDAPVADSTDRAPAALGGRDAPVEQPSSQSADAAFVPQPAIVPESPPKPPAAAVIESQSAERVANPEEVAETVYFQVLQNLDLFTERALQQHLTEHLFSHHRAGCA